MTKIFSLLMVLMCFTICALHCSDRLNADKADSTAIMTPYPPAMLAGYYDGWKNKDVNTEYIVGATVIGICVPFLGNTVLYDTIRGAKPSVIPTNLDSLLYVQGYEEASKIKRQVSVDIPRRITNYNWSAGLIFIVGLAVYFERHPLFGD